MRDALGVNCALAETLFIPHIGHNPEQKELRCSGDVLPGRQTLGSTKFYNANQHLSDLGILYSSLTWEQGPQYVIRLMSVVILHTVCCDPTRIIK